jgi:hypothetical protein
MRILLRCLGDRMGPSNPSSGRWKQFTRQPVPILQAVQFYPWFENFSKHRSKETVHLGESQWNPPTRDCVSSAVHPSRRTEKGKCIAPDSAGGKHGTEETRGSQTSKKTQDPKETQATSEKTRDVSIQGVCVVSLAWNVLSV